jgi:general stress protein 26
MTSFPRVSTPENLSEEDKRGRIKQMLADFTTAMLVTRGRDGALHARPLSIAGTREDGGLYFSTSIDSGKVHEIEADPNVNVALHGDRRYVSLTGTASIVRDRALIDRLWSESWRIWFPQGKDDPSLCVLVIQPSEAAYWDMSGTHGLKYLLQMAKGYLTHQHPTSDSDQGHTGHVKL